MKNKFNITCFAGSKQDYESWKGYECRIVGANASLYHEAIYLDGELYTEPQNIEALVNVTFIPGIDYGTQSVYGLPIQRQEK